MMSQQQKSTTTLKQLGFLSSNQTPAKEQTQWKNLEVQKPLRPVS